MPTLEEHKQAYTKAMQANDTLAAYKIKNIIEDTIQSQNQSVTPESDIDVTPKPESTLLSRAGDVIEKRSSSIEDTLSRSLATDAGAILGTQEEGALGLGEVGIRVAGDFAGGIGEIAGDAILTGLSNVTPEFMKEAAEDALNYVSKTTAGKEGLKLAAQSAEKYKGWSEANPDDAKLLESYFNIGALIAPPTLKVKAPLIYKAEYLEETGGNLVKGGRSKIRGKKRDLVMAMMEPDAKHKTAEDFDISETETLTYNPRSEYTQETIDLVTDLDVVDPKKTYTFNSKNLAEAARKERAVLERQLARENVKLNKVDVETEVQSKAQEFLVNAQRTLQDPETTKKANLIFQEAARQIRDGDGSLLSLLQARRNVDKFTGAFQGKVNFETQNSLSTASKSVRDAMNDIIDREAKSTKVSESLRKQSAYLDAHKILDKKINQDGRSWWIRSQNFMGQYLPRTPLAQLATATAVTTGVAKFAPLLLPVVGAGILFGGVKAAKSGEAKELLGQTIKNYGTAIKKANELGHLDGVEQLKADRLVAISLLNETPKEEIEE